MTLLLALACGLEDNLPEELPALALDGVLPTSGVPGDVVQLVGGGYTAGTTVTVGGKPCTTLELLSGSTLACEVPGNAAGGQRVYVERTEDGAAAEGTFTYLEGGTTPTGTTTTSGLACSLVDSDLRTTEASAVTASANVTGDATSAEVGLGAGSDPASFTWATAAVGAGVASGELSADVGSWFYALRVRAASADPWTTCLGAEGAPGTLTVEPAGGGPVVEYCHLQYPCEITADAGTLTPEVYCWVYHEGVTVGAGQGSGVSVQVGVGSVGTSPEGSGWTWTAATYNVDVDGLIPGDLANDEYGTAIVAPSTAGTWDFGCRVSLDAGVTWRTCDLGDGGTGSCGAGLGGSGDGWDTLTAGKLRVP